MASHLAIGVLGRNRVVGDAGRKTPHHTTLASCLLDATTLSASHVNRTVEQRESL